MSATAPSLPISLGPDPGAGCHARPRRMARCECAEVSFNDVAKLMRAEGLSVEQACDRTGCGRTCTGCLPDLEHFFRR